MLVHAMHHDEIPPLEMPDRFLRDIAYFMTPAGEDGVPELGKKEFWVGLKEAQQWLDDGVLEVVSPLDSQRHAEIEISEQQEAWLEWMVKNQIEHVRLD
ncbi:MAG: hypothetical protein N2C12_06240 [Planctomycetales bacterium]